MTKTIYHVLLLRLLNTAKLGWMLTRLWTQKFPEFPAIRWRPLTAFPLKILDNVSSIGSGARIVASSHRGSTSKGTKVSNL